MEVHLINVQTNWSNHTGSETIFQVGIPGVQVCYFDRYKSELERIAKLHECTKIEVFDHQYKFAGTIDSGKINISFN